MCVMCVWRGREGGRKEGRKEEWEGGKGKREGGRKEGRGGYHSDDGGEAHVEGYHDGGVQRCEVQDHHRVVVELTLWEGGLEDR